MPLFDPDTGKLLDRDALKSVGFGMTNLRDKGAPGGDPKKVKDPGRPAPPSKGYTP
ncbi:MAG: hypothetical protein ACOYOQ_00315 [Microthrixaceae bacterium]